MFKNPLALLLVAAGLISSCSEDDKTGCTDSDACNYDASANSSNGSCYYICLNDQEKSRVTDFVESAIDYLDQHGAQHAFATFDSLNGSFVKDELYIWVWDSTATVLSHGFQHNLIGTNVYDIQDIEGKFFVHEMIDNIKLYGEGWTWYYWDDPQTNTIRKKFGFVKDHNGLIVGSGTYK